MTLVSCSGTIGRTSYARPEMGGMWSSQGILKIVPDPALVRPGYLHAFLSSRFGLPLVTGGTYGAIVQHVEPQHVARVPVPPAPDDVQEEAHRLVTEAAAMRTAASAELRAIIREIEEVAGLPSTGGIGPGYVAGEGQRPRRPCSITATTALCWNRCWRFRRCGERPWRSECARCSHASPTLHYALLTSQTESSKLRQREHGLAPESSSPTKRSPTIGTISLCTGTNSVRLDSIFVKTYPFFHRGLCSTLAPNEGSGSYARQVDCPWLGRFPSATLPGCQTSTHSLDDAFVLRALAVLLEGARSCSQRTRGDTLRLPARVPVPSGGHLAFGGAALGLEAVRSAFALR